MLGYVEIKNEDTSITVKDEPISEASEGEDDGNDWKNVENVEDGHEPVHVENHERDTSTEKSKVKQRYCSYCFELTERKDMILVPFTASIRQEWINAFGKQFESHIEGRKEPFLCRKHFDYQESKKSCKTPWIERFRPKAEAIYDGRVFEDYRHKKSDSERLFRCCYCGVQEKVTKMKSVPSSEEKRDLWSRKLGEQFRKNIENKLYGFVCKSHFPKSLTSEDGRVSNMALPLTFEESLNESANTFPITITMGCKCVYCGEHGLIAKMVPVPEGPNRDSWCYILGDRFAMNLTKLEHLYICSSHFHDEKPTKDSMPFPDDFMELREVDKKGKKTLHYTCTYCRGWISCRNMIVIPMTPFRLETWCDILGEEFEYTVFVMETTRMCKIHFRKEDFENNRYRKLKPDAFPILSGVPQRTRPSDMPTTKKCLYCGKIDKFRNMKRVFYDAHKWNLWLEVFGADFDEMFFKEQSNLPAVCRAHLSDEGTPLIYNNLRELEEVPSCCKIDVPHKHFESSQPGCSTDVKSSVIPSGKRKKVVVGGLYKYGWETTDAMNIHCERVQKASTLYENTVYPKRKIDRCFYCSFPIVEKSARLHFVEQDRHLWQDFGKVFGLQYSTKLKYDDSEIIENPPAKMMCKRHVDQFINPIPDTGFLYATDALLDHTYAIFR